MLVIMTTYSLLKDEGVGDAPVTRWSSAFFSAQEVEILSAHVNTPHQKPLWVLSSHECKFLSVTVDN